MSTTAARRASSDSSGRKTVSGSPMTYRWRGRQYIVIAVSGGNYSGEYIAFALPSSGSDTSGTRE